MTGREATSGKDQWQITIFRSRLHSFRERPVRSVVANERKLLVSYLSKIGKHYVSQNTCMYTFYLYMSLKKLLKLFVLKDVSAFGEGDAHL